MSIADFIEEIRAEDYGAQQAGGDYAPSMKHFFERLGGHWDKGYVDPLRGFDFEEDKKVIRTWMQSFFETRPPIPGSMRTLMLWFIGAGPRYPISFTGFADTIAPVTQDIYETDALGDELWPNDDETPMRQLERDHKFLSQEEQQERWGIAAVQEFCYAPFPEFLTNLLGRISEEEETELEEREDLCIFDIESLILLFYGAHLVPWFATEFKNCWLENTEELHLIYGFESDDATIAGRLSRAAGWQPVAELLAG